MRRSLEVLQLYPAHDYTIHQALASRAARNPGRPFILFRDRVWTWREFDDAAERCASALMGRGVAAGDRVAVVGQNSDAHLLLLAGLARLGAVMVPVNPAFAVAEARFVLSHAGVSGVFCGADVEPVARQASAAIDPAPWLLPLDAVGSGSPDDLLLGAIDRPLPRTVSSEDVCLIIYTSGTTGFPKGVMHSQRNFLTAGEAFVERVHLQDDDRVMIILPLYHMNALFYSVGGAIAAGASLIIVPKFSASTFWHTAADYGATQVNCIEAVGTILKVRPRAEFRADHRIRVAYGVRQNAAETFRNEFGIHHLVGGYGMTEIPGVTSTPYEGHDKPGTMGIVAHHPDPSRPWAACRVVDDEGRDVGADEAGELWVKTPILMKGYFRDPDATRASFHDGWFKTGDLVRRDTDGYFFFLSRRKDIIRRRGENIAAAEIDRIIGEAPGVQEVAVIGVPSELGEEEILAAIVPKAGPCPSAEEIAAWCRGRLAPMKTPRFIVFVDALPRTPTHKISKASLRQDATLRRRAIDLGEMRPA